MTEKLHVMKYTRFLNRLLNQKRYKYLSDAAYNESKAQIDYDRSITYKEYLEQTQ